MTDHVTGGTAPVAEQDYLEDNIATLAFHMGRPGARLTIANEVIGVSGLLVHPGEVLKEASRRLSRPAQQPLKPEIIDAGGRNPMIVVSPDQVADWLRSIADAAGYADRSSVAIQVKTVGVLGEETIRAIPPQLVLMVSNIPHSRTSALPSTPSGTEPSAPASEDRTDGR